MSQDKDLNFTKRASSVNAPTPAEAKWTPIMEEWRKSGMRGSDFCRQRGIRVTAFGFWKREIERRQERRKPPSKRRPGAARPMKFVPMRLVGGNGPGGSALDVVLAGGRTIRVAGDFAPEVLSKLVSTLESLAR